MRLALCAGSFAKDIAAGQASLERIFQVAKDYGFHELEIRDDLLDESVHTVTTVLDWADKYGLTLIYAHQIWPLDQDLSKMKENEPLFREALHTAQALGASILKVGFGNVDSMEEWTEQHSSVIREWLKTADEAQVTVCLENGRQQPELMAAVLQHINHPRLATTMDTGNYAQADEDPVRATQLLAKLTGYVHLKDISHSGKKTWLGDGDISFPEIFQTMQAHHYDGPWCFEFPMSIDRLDEIKQSLEYFNFHKVPVE